MTHFLLDTNIVSQLAKPEPSRTLIDWWSRQADEDLYISAHTLGEIWRGILLLPVGARRNAFISWFQGPQSPPALFEGRILSYDLLVSLRWAEIMAEQGALGRPRPVADILIAATALVHNCILVTDNERDFDGVVEIINPVRNEIP